ncbi:MAG: hypothetical protein EB020_10535 [Proteobacteria bacterium]|nr:hypothetical protein [Pseudomonadota bacterium]NDB21296.1 hypothetical protein [Pseudomonadota bacterium]NDB72646.1 hypothetical protein [Pseudomonadota bacterium]NDF08720.1 hypothetical protein [Pseudomonadota bacterium]NDF40459.1 hypothetical protein [Pseudomonadota bacterium]
MPRAGDGWSIVRPGDVLPMDPDAPRGSGQARHVPVVTTQVDEDIAVAEMSTPGETPTGDLETATPGGDTD